MSVKTSVWSFIYSTSLIGADDTLKVEKLKLEGWIFLNV